MRLCVIPNEPIQAYIDRGLSAKTLWNRLNPDDFFGEVYMISWQETEDWNYGDLKVVSLLPDEKALRKIETKLTRLDKPKALPKAFVKKIFHRFQEEIVSTLRNVDPDIIRAYNGHWAAELGEELSQKLRAPFICSVRYGQHIVPSALAKANAVICVSEALKQSLLQKGIPEGKIDCIPGFGKLEICEAQEENSEYIAKRELALYQSLIPEQEETYHDRVSIVLPTYNGAKHIRKSIDSCLNQTHQNIELIIVNDCSTDETSEIVKSYRDPRIKYIEHKANRKLPAALNTGFANATGEYLTWTSDDNFYAPEAIRTLLSFLHSYPDVDFVYSDMHVIDEDDEVVDTFEVKSIDVLINYGNCIGACFLYKREVYERTGGFNPDAVLVEDYEYWLRVSRNFRMQRLRRKLYYYRSHSQSLTSKYPRHISRMVNKMRKNILLNGFGVSRKLRAQLYMLVAYDEYMLGNLTRTRSNIILAILYNPLYLRSMKLIPIVLELILGKWVVNQIVKIKKRITCLPQSI